MLYAYVVCLYVAVSQSGGGVNSVNDAAETFPVRFDSGNPFALNCLAQREDTWYDEYG